MFSIIIPSYNRKNQLLRLLNILNNQSISIFEVIVVDDCSEDIVTVSDEYKFDLTIIRNDVNLGVSKSRNIGAAYAKKDWLLFLDDDDVFMDNKCEVLLEVINNNPNVNFIYHPAKCEMINEGFIYYTHPTKDINILTIENMLRINRIGGMPMISVKKSLFLSVGGLTESLYALEDYEFLLKIIKNSYFKPYYINSPLTYCRFYTNRSSVSTNIKNTQKAIDYIYKYYVNNESDKKSFKLNSLYMMGYTYIMRLSRYSAKYYFSMFLESKNIKFLAISIISFISPKLLINLKRLF